MDLGHSIWTKDQHKVMSYVICNRCNSAGHDSSLCPQKVDRLKTAVSVTCYSFGERGGGSRTLSHHCPHGNEWRPICNYRKKVGVVKATDRGCQTLEG